MKLTLAEIAMPTGIMNSHYYTVSGITVGFIEYFKYDDCILLHRVFTAHGRRGKGFGTDLLEDFMTRHQDDTVVLRAAGDEFCPMDNDALVEWYRRHGFKMHAAWSDCNVMVNQ